MSETMNAEGTVIENLSRDEKDRVFAHLQSLGYLKTPADRGAMIVMGSPLRYAYDAEAKTLEVALLMPSKIITAPKIAALIEREGRRPQSLLKDDVDELAPADNHVEVTLHNTSGKTLINSEESVSVGVLRVIEDRIESGQEKLAFEARSAKWSVAGAKGSVSYQIDGQTTLTINYFLDGPPFHQCSATIKGANATRYKATVTGTETRCVCESDRGPWLEMTPTVKLEKA